jgi:hypothetical protein
MREYFSNTVPVSDFPKRLRARADVAFLGSRLPVVTTCLNVMPPLPEFTKEELEWIIEQCRPQGHTSSSHTRILRRLEDLLVCHNVSHWLGFY